MGGAIVLGPSEVCIFELFIFQGFFKKIEIYC